MTPPSPSSAPAPGLTADQKRQWDRDGYLILPDALAPTQVADLLAATHQLLADVDLRTHPMTRFSTGESAPHVGDAYFLESGDQIRFFFEPDAFSPGGALLRRPDAAINKIGHGLHRRHPGFRAATLTARHAAIARDLGFRDPRVLQSMVVCKQPQLGARVPPHQDSTFLYTDPPSAVGFWYALQDCAPDNGCLSFAPGSHARVPVARRFVRNADGGGTAFVANEGSRWPEGLEPRRRRRWRGEGEEDEDEEWGEEDEEYVLGPVKAGTLVLIHGNLLHKSEKNLSPKGRMAYTFHLIEAEHHYDARNWLQPPAEGFTKLNQALAA